MGFSPGFLCSGRRMLFLSMSTLLLGGCKPKTLAPFPEDEPAELTLDTLGYFKGETAVVEGVAKGLEALTVNGVEVFRNEDAYQATVPLVPGVNLIEVQGTDRFGDPKVVRQGVLSGTFSPAEDRIEKAVTVRLNDSGIDAAMEITEDLLVAQDVPGLLAGFNPVLDTSYDVLGFEAGSIRVDILDVDFARPILIANPRAGVVDMTATLPFLGVELHATGSAIGIDFDQEVTVDADAVDLQLDLGMEIEGGDLAISTANPRLNLVGFTFDVSAIPDVVEGFLVDRVRGILEERVQGVLDDLLPTLLEDRFADLEIAFATQVLGKDFAIEGFLENAQIDSNGIELSTGVRIDAERDGNSGGVGYLSVRTPPTTPSATDDLALAVSDNLLNNLLYQAWGAGLLALDLDSARGDIDAGLLTPLGATGAARIFVNAATPPVLIEQDGSAMVQITELLVRVETPGGDKGEFLDLAVTALVDLDLVVDQGVLKLSLNEPIVSVDVRDSDWGLEDQSLTNLLAEQLPIDTLLSLLGDIEIPLPSVAGISIDNAVAERDATGVHTTIGANL